LNGRKVFRAALSDLHRIQAAYGLDLGLPEQPGST
jgi:hypothetical protein